MNLDTNLDTKISMENTICNVARQDTFGNYQSLYNSLVNMYVSLSGLIL